MALSEDQIEDLYAKLESLSKSLEGSGLIDEHNTPEAYGTILDAMNLAQTAQQDVALIRQLVEAMEGVKALNMGGELALWTAEFDRLLSAIAAARARMSPPPTA